MRTQPAMAASARAGRFGLVQIVVLELAAMAVVTTGYARPSHLLVAVGLSAAALLPVVGRHHGRWGYEILVAWRALRARRRAASQAVYEGWVKPPELALFAPDLVVRNVLCRDMAIGVGSDAWGWFAAIAVSASDGLTGDGAVREVRLEWLSRLAGPLSTVQLLERHMPSPPGADPRSPCARSYRELCATLGVPPQHDTWVAVRLGLHDAAAAVAERDGDPDGIHRELASALSRIGDSRVPAPDGQYLQVALTTPP